jgi:hypothetical protein
MRGGERGGQRGNAHGIRSIGPDSREAIEFEQ